MINTNNRKNKSLNYIENNNTSDANFAEKVSNGNRIDGNVTDGNVTDGNVTDGNVSDDNITTPGPLPVYKEMNLVESAFAKTTVMNRLDSLRCAYMESGTPVNPRVVENIRMAAIAYDPTDTDNQWFKHFMADVFRGVSGNYAISDQLLYSLAKDTTLSDDQFAGSTRLLTITAADLKGLNLNSISRSELAEILKKAGVSRKKVSKLIRKSAIPVEKIMALLEDALLSVDDILEILSRISGGMEKVVELLENDDSMSSSEIRQTIEAMNLTTEQKKVFLEKYLPKKQLLELVKDSSIGKEIIFELVKDSSIGKEALVELVKDSSIGRNALIELVKDSSIGMEALIELVKDSSIGKEALIELVKDSSIGRQLYLELVKDSSIGREIFVQLYETAPVKYDTAVQLLSMIRNIVNLAAYIAA